MIKDIAAIHNNWWAINNYKDVPESAFVIAHLIIVVELISIVFLIVAGVQQICPIH